MVIIPLTYLLFQGHLCPKSWITRSENAQRIGKSVEWCSDSHFLKADPTPQCLCTESSLDFLSTQENITSFVMKFRIEKD